MEPMEVPHAPTPEQISSELKNGLFLLLFALGFAVLCGGVVVYFLWDHSRFLKDAEAITGVVQSIERSDRRDHRGRRLITHYAIVKGDHGTMRISITDPLPVGAKVDYLYSPSMMSARIPGGMDTWWWLGSLFFFLVVYTGFRSYAFLRSWYLFSHGHYVVVRQP